MKKDDATRVWVSQLATLNETEQHAVWRQWLTRVDVSADRLRILINPTEHMTPDSSQSEALANDGWETPLARVVDVPWVMAQRGGQADIKVKGAVPQIQSQPNEALVDRVGPGVSVERRPCCGTSLNREGLGPTGRGRSLLCTAYPAVEFSSSRSD